jgi:hypothetical protein
MRRLIAIVIAVAAPLLMVLPANARGAAAVPIDVSQSWTCDLYERITTGNPPVERPGNLVADPQPGQWYIVVCTYQQSIVIQKAIQYVPNQPYLDGGDIAALAAQILSFAKPTPSMAPPIDKRQLAGVRTWLWIDQSAWQSGRLRVDIPGMAVRASAEPQAVRWVFASADAARWPNDVKTVTCKNAGTPYVNESQPPTTCFRALQHAGMYHVDVFIDWTVLWVASDNTFGTMTVSLAADRFTVFADQRQAVITG